MNDFPFNLKDVAELCGIPTKKTDGNEYVTCPFCGKKRKMNFKYSTNQYNCPACNEGGFMLSLYSKLNGIENKSNGEITAEIKQKLGISDEITYKKPLRNKKEIKTDKDNNTVNISEMKRIDAVYRAFLSKLSMSEFHYDGLINRGLNDKDINRWLFKSVPLFGYKRICRELIEEGHNLEGVAGFYWDCDSWSIDINSKLTGTIIPAWGIYGYIEALQIRLDKPLGKCKYLWISSDDKCNGTKANAAHFFVKGSKRNDTLVITEGAFKAIIPSKVFGYSVFAVAGVNNQSDIIRAIPKIKEMGYTKIMECFDADFRFNENVKKAKDKLKNTMEEHGFTYSTFEWEYSQGKGFDDFALYTYQKGLEQS